MNAFAASNIAVAKRHLDRALARIEVVAEGGPESWIGLAYADMRVALGCPWDVLLGR